VPPRAGPSSPISPPLLRRSSVHAATQVNGPPLQRWCYGRRAQPREEDRSYPAPWLGWSSPRVAMGGGPSSVRYAWQMLDRMSTREIGGGNLTCSRCKVTISICAHASNTIPTPPGSEGTGDHPPGSEGTGDQTSDTVPFKPSYGWPQLATQSGSTGPR
jgi:hypothetical protein